MEIKQRLLVSWYLQHVNAIKKWRKQTITAATAIKRPDFNTKTRQIAFIEAILMSLPYARPFIVDASEIIHMDGDGGTNL